MKHWFSSHSLAVLAVMCGLAAPAAGCRSRQSPPAARVGAVEIIEPFLLEPIRPDVTSGYMTFRNEGDSADALLDATTPAAGMAMLHGSQGGGLKRMTHLPRLELPPHATVALAPGQTHLMLTDIRRTLAPGDTVPITLGFQRAGLVTVPFVVRTYESIGR